MAITQNTNSLSDPKQEVFTRVKTSVAVWASEDAATKAEYERLQKEAQLLAKLKSTFTDNNLDLSWQGQRVIILDKKGENAVEHITRNAIPYPLDELLMTVFNSYCQWCSHYSLLST